MKKSEGNKKLYHYCSTKTAYAILQGKTLRMSDITNSNDYNEIYMFFPGILDAIKDQYDFNPFQFEFNGATDREAIHLLLNMEYRMIDDLFREGGLTSFVVCFCEDGNLLSQWRGYADDGKGCSLGFSECELNELCSRENNLLKLVKVKYKTPKQLDSVIINRAKKILRELEGVRFYIESEMQLISKNGKTDVAIAFIFHTWICRIIIDSLQYKNSAYKEECEWRLYFSKNVKEESKLMFCDDIIDTLGNDDLVKMLRNKIEFNVTDKKIIPFYPLNIFDLSGNPIKEMFLGPENAIKKKDLELLFAKLGYKGIRVKHSTISYRSR